LDLRWEGEGQMKCSLLEDQNSKQVGRLYTTFERYQGVVGSVVSAVRSRKRIQIYRLTRRPIIEADIARFFEKSLKFGKGFDVSLRVCVWRVWTCALNLGACTYTFQNRWHSDQAAFMVPLRRVCDGDVKSWWKTCSQLQR
jgi:hypothetical protein